MNKQPIHKIVFDLLQVSPVTPYLGETSGWAPSGSGQWFPNCPVLDLVIIKYWRSVCKLISLAAYEPSSNNLLKRPK